MNRIFIQKPRHHFSLVKKMLCVGALLFGTVADSSAQWVKIGTATPTGYNTMTSYPTPFGGANAGQRAQYMYKPSELRAAGLQPGWIDSLAFVVRDDFGSTVLTNLKFYVGTPSLAALKDTTAGAFTTTTWDATLPLRFFDPVIATFPVMGIMKFPFVTPYYWNGTDNIIVGTCFWSGIDYRNAGVEWTNVGYNASLTRTSAKSTSAGIGVCDAITAGTLSNFRPNIIFTNKKDTCASKPIAGTAFSVVPNPPGFCIFDDSLTLGLTGTSLGYGLSFQWQRSLSSTGPWTNMGTASTTRSDKKAYQTVSTYYRCIVTCVAKSLMDTSEIVLVDQAAPSRCDCASASLDGTKEKVLSVSLGTLYNASPCTGLPISFSDYTVTSTTSTPVTPPDLEPGTDYKLAVRLGSCDTFNRNRAVKVFIDFDKSATYEITEMVYSNTYSSAQPNPQNASGSFTVPLSAASGVTTMRIVYGQATTLSDLSACGDYSVGETQDYSVNILKYGKPSVSGRLTVCQYDSVVMNASSAADTPVVFNWTGPGGFTATGPKITFVNADPSLSGTYYVTATSVGRTSTPLAVLVTVYPKPSIPNVLNSEMCQYEPDGTLRTDGKNVLWYIGPVGGYGDTIPPKLPTDKPITHSFYLTQTVNGCVSDRAKVVVNINQKPEPPVVKSPVTYCQLQDADLVARGTNLKWYLDSVGGVASTISLEPPTGFPDSLYYYVTQTEYGCESDRARIKVIVYEQPNGLILHTKPFVCQYDTASFIYYGNAPATYQYKWFTTDATYISGGGQGSVVYKFDTYGDKVISLFVNNGKCATFKITDTITVRQAPTADIDTILNACIDVPVNISIDTAEPNIERFDWNWDGGNLAYETENGGPYGLVWSNPGTKTMHLTVYKRTCASLDITQSIYVHDRPFAKIVSWNKVTNYGKDTNVITGKICTRDTIVFTAYKDPNYIYKWYPEYYFDLDTTNIVSDRMKNATYIRVDVENQFGCKSADSVYIYAQPCCAMDFPNAFTPNNDNKNDMFRPLRDGRQDIVTFRVVNRWGQTVYETANTDSEGWDGTFAGKAQDMGVYQYYVKYRCQDGVYYERKGDVTLIR
ncbi:MAG: gliding motility-associated C-terminal domain-containing protein [Phycisphaerales bacterium]|nr:gliding motility-associated C-terminal domain-containing protein [Phycisphaerales bacterium]